MDKDLTEIIVITDRSGSMGTVAADTIGGFNTFLAEQQKAKIGRCLLTYCQFDNEYEVVHEALPIEKMKPLDNTTFVPRGSTALLDAVGKTIDDVGKRLAKTPEEKRPSNIVVVIMTDGEENSSQHYTLDDVKARIERQTNEYKWTFVFLGQNIDAFEAGHGMGLSNANANVFVGNMAQGGQGQNQAYYIASAAILGTRHRAMKGASTSFSSAEKESYTKGLIGDSDEVNDLKKGYGSSSDSSPKH